MSLNTLEPSGKRDGSPERLLWLAVVGQAVCDATIADAVLAEAPPTSELPGVRSQARAILFSVSAPTVEYFDTVCDLAGVDAAYVRDFVKDCIVHGRVIPHANLVAALALGEVE